MTLLSKNFRDTGVNLSAAAAIKKCCFRRFPNSCVPDVLGQQNKLFLTKFSYWKFLEAARNRNPRVSIFHGRKRRRELASSASSATRCSTAPRHLLSPSLSLGPVRAGSGLRPVGGNIIYGLSVVATLQGLSDHRDSSSY